MKGFSKILLVVVALVACQVAASAALVNLSDLIVPGATLQSGDKLFSDWSCEVVTNSGAVSGGCGGTVKPITDEFGNFGFEVGNFFSAGGDGGGTLDVHLDYTVTVVGTSNLLSDVHMKFDATAPFSTASTSVSEAVCPAGSGSLCENPLAVIDVLRTSGGLVQLSDSADLTSKVTSARVFKDIGLTANSSGFVSFSHLDQTWSQTGGVPEPASLGLLGSALVGLAVLARRKMARG